MYISTLSNQAHGIFIYHLHDILSTSNTNLTSKGIIISHNTHKSPRGFTIVELLIVIVVIGILAAISIVAYSGIQDRAKTTRAKTDIRNLTQAIQAARISTGKTLRNITGSNDSRQTKALADTAIDQISIASGMNISGLKNGDPWGNYYRIDENELEQSPTDCRNDTIDALTQNTLSVQIPVSQPPCL